MKSLAVVQSNYIPWIGYFDLINTVDEFILFDDVQYTKRDWRNKNYIKTPSGPLRLTIPVETKGKFFQKINQTQIKNANWQKDHWNAICLNYKKSKHFNEVSNFLEKIYLDKEFNYLSDVNASLINHVSEMLGIETKITDSREYNLQEGKNERLISLCHQSNSSIYYSGPAAKNYIEEHLFNENGIEVRWFEYGIYPEYSQLWGEFIPNLSIIDYLMNKNEKLVNYF